MQEIRAVMITALPLQSYRPLLYFIPTLQKIWSGPAKNSAVMTSTPRSASHYRGVEVITALFFAGPDQIFCNVGIKYSNGR